jgi:hypothetical protein
MSLHLPTAVKEMSPIMMMTPMATTMSMMITIITILPASGASIALMPALDSMTLSM